MVQRKQLALDKGELERIEKNSHKFLTYFGVFWGAIILFFAQNYTQPGIATIIGGGVIEYIKNFPYHGGSDFPYVGVLGLALLVSSIFINLVVLIFLSANASTIRLSDLSSKESSDAVNLRYHTLRKSVALGLIGSILLFILFVLVLMSRDDQLAAQIEFISKLIGTIFLLMVFVGDPIAILNEGRKDKPYKAWLVGLNFASATLIVIAFLLILTGLGKSSGGFFVFLLAFTLIYTLARVAVSFVWKPFFFYRRFVSLFPDVPSPEKKSSV